MKKWKSRSKADKQYIVVFTIVTLVFYLLLIRALFAHSMLGVALSSGCSGVSFTYLTHVRWRK